MNKRSILVSIICFIVIAVIAVGLSNEKTSVPNASSSTAPLFTQTVSDGVIIFGIPADFGVAVTKEQALVRSYIPPCDENFDYCVYYSSSTYAGTNFESAGIRVSKRPDLGTEQVCLSAFPDGYSQVPAPNILKKPSYATSAFAPVGDAATGHYASGTLYRLFAGGACYEFETRIGQSRFENYPAGAIREFTAEDRQELDSKLSQIIENVKLASGEKVEFPAPTNVPR